MSVGGCGAGREGIISILPLLICSGSLSKCKGIVGESALKPESVFSKSSAATETLDLPL